MWIKRVVYPRGDDAVGTPWAPLETPIGRWPVTDLTRVEQVVHPRADVEAQGWLRYTAETIQLTNASADQSLGSYRLPRRALADTRYHGEWRDDHTWIIQALLGQTFQVQWAAAFDQLASSYRARRFPHRRPHRVGAARQRFAEELGRPAADQALGGYRAPERRRLSPPLVWVDEAGWITANTPSDVTRLAPTLHQLAVYRAPNRRTRGDDLLWGSHAKSAVGFPEDLTIWAPAFAHLLESYRLPTHSLLDVRRHGDWELPIAWPSFVVREQELPRQWPALEQLLSGYLPPGRHRFRPSIHDWLDTEAWISAFAAFDPSQWPALEGLLHAYIMPAGRRLDVRRGDLPLEGWLGLEPNTLVPSFTAAHADLSEVYRMLARRRTMDLDRSEWAGPMGWLKGALTLEEPSPVVQAHHRKIVAAIMRRRRQRRR